MSEPSKSRKCDMGEHYRFDEVSWARQMLDIDQGSLDARKLERIGVDLEERKEQARTVLRKNGVEG